MRAHRQTIFTLIPIVLFLIGNAPVFADEPESPDPAVVESASSNPENKLVAEFSELLGGEENSRTVVQSLREGTYGQTPPEDGAATETSQTGWGNVRITLKLAEARLAADGITQPTAEQLDAVLLGSESDPNGILALRESGMGWGKISQQYGYKLGTLMGNGKTPTAEPAATSGVSTAANASLNPGQAKKGGYIPSGSSHAPGQGITTAAGGTAASVSNGNAYGQDKVKISSAGGANKGVITTAGGSTNAAAVSNAGGNASNGKALGHSKK